MILFECVLIFSFIKLPTTFYSKLVFHVGWGKGCISKMTEGRGCINPYNWVQLYYLFTSKWVGRKWVQKNNDGREGLHISCQLCTAILMFYNEIGLGMWVV